VAKRTTFVRNSSAIGVEMLGNTITGNVLASDRSKARVTR
jgi:hypothetical protein